MELKLRLFASKYSKQNFSKEVKPYSINKDESEQIDEKWHAFTVLILEDLENNKIESDSIHKLIKICLTDRTKDNYAIIQLYPNSCKPIIQNLESLEESEKQEGQENAKAKQINKLLKPSM